MRNGGVYVGKGVCLRSESTSGSNFRPTTVVIRVRIRIIAIIVI